MTASGIDALMDIISVIPVLLLLRISLIGMGDPISIQKQLISSNCFSLSEMTKCGIIDTHAYISIITIAISSPPFLLRLGVQILTEFQASV